MPTTVICPECDAKMVVPENLLGKKIRCKKCDAVVKTKAPVEDDDEPRAKKSSGRRPPNDEEGRRTKRQPDQDEPRRRRARDDGDDEEEDDEEERPARKAKKKKKKKSPLPLIIGVLAALSLVGGAIGAVGWSRGWFDGKPIDDASKPIARATVEEDYTEHVRLRFVEFFETKDDRAGAIFDLEFPKPLGNYSLYYTVHEDANGKQHRTPLTQLRLQNGKQKLTVIFGRLGENVRFSYWIGKKKIRGTEDDLVRVSNLIRVPEDVGK
jgi:transcription initiation factor TFIIIB Brf1 subunit/transcription initiation factor TFIIB